MPFVMLFYDSRDYFLWGCEVSVPEDIDALLERDAFPFLVSLWRSRDLKLKVLVTDTHT